MSIVLLMAALLVWEPSEGASGYKVYHGRTVTGPFTNVARVTGTNWAVPQLPAGLHVFYVTALSEREIETAPSNTEQELVPLPPPGVRLIPVPGPVN